MGRKRTELGPDADAQIKARTERGESAETVAAALGGAVSVSTIRRRQVALRGRGSKPAPPAPAALDATDDVPETIPDEAPVELIRRWLARVEKGARAAEEAENLPALASLAMRAASLAEALRKATPLPKADPNENPDMRALAEQGEKRLMALIDDLFAPGAA